MKEVMRGKLINEDIKQLSGPVLLIFKSATTRLCINNLNGEEVLDHESQGNNE